MKFIHIALLTSLLLPISTQTAKSIAKPLNSLIKHQLIAQAFLDDRCPEQYVYLQGSTKNYSVKICGQRGTGLPTHYIADYKRNRSTIFLPLSSYTDTQFVARSGRYTTYKLDLKTNTLTIKTPRQRPRVERFTIDLP